MPNKNPNYTGLEIAVIGVSCRFPGAENLSEYWGNLSEGKEMVPFFSDDELQEFGISPEIIKDKNFVKTNGAQLDGKENFDAGFFEYSDSEAELMDPQTRVFHHCCWEALDDGGYANNPIDYNIGLFAGSSSSFYWEVLSLINKSSDGLDSFSNGLLSSNNYLASRIAYKLGLKGPSVFINTACSTSLVAIHLATRALLTGDCNMALAGGVRLTPFQTKGYMYSAGMINSPDGHCRSFDRDANGTIGGEGAGVVLLKPLKKALEDKDNIYAIIKGSAINNDGNRKVGFTAPSVKGQYELISKALKISQVSPDSVSFIETHGTGTPLGDEIEVEAIKKAYNTENRQLCALGAVKTNIGHLDTAAGIAGFIKVILSLQHKKLLPTINHKKTNPSLKLSESQFYVNTEFKEWEPDNGLLRAGISSFGIGGTNAHIIMEEAEVPISGESRSDFILFLSARTENELQKSAEKLYDYLQSKTTNDLADIAYTLLTGKKRFNFRSSIICSSVSEACEKLSLKDGRYSNYYEVTNNERPVIFVFSGLGNQRLNLALELFKDEKYFREQFKKCSELIKTKYSVHIEDILYPSELNITSEKQLDDFITAQFIIFTIQYSVSRLLMYWGIQPEFLIGYSFGEYTAACISGAISLEDSLKMIYKRGELIENGTSGGVMISIPLPKEELDKYLNDNVWVAINNGKSCVVAGEKIHIKKLEELLRSQKIMSFPIKSSYAVHTPLMQNVSQDFKKEISTIEFKSPKIPVLSNLTGEWINEEQRMDADYWSNHLCKPVNFNDQLKKLTNIEDLVLLEIGPGREILSIMSGQISDSQSATSTFNIPTNDITERRYFYSAIGKLIQWGKELNWNHFFENENRYKVALPTYPFEKTRYWFKKGLAELNGKTPFSFAGNTTKIENCFYQTRWVIDDDLEESNVRAGHTNILIFTDEKGIGKNIDKYFTENKCNTILVTKGTVFDQISKTEYKIDPGNDQHYKKLIRTLWDINFIPNKIVHLFSLDTDHFDIYNENDFIYIQQLSFYSIINTITSLGDEALLPEIELLIIVNNLYCVTGNENILPNNALSIGCSRVIPMEYPNIKAKCVEITVPDVLLDNKHDLARTIAKEIERRVIRSGTVSAIRGEGIWRQIFLKKKLTTDNEIKLKKNGNYLILGGTGGIGLTMAKNIAKKSYSNIFLLVRSDFPKRDSWQKILSDQGNNYYEQIFEIKEIEKLGAKIFVQKARIDNSEEFENAIRDIQDKHGDINGVIHAAGILEHGLIQQRTKESISKVLSPKINGLLLLCRFIDVQKLDFLVLNSSTNSFIALPGTIGHVSSSVFFDIFSVYLKRQGVNCISINWDSWKYVGMAEKAKSKYGYTEENFLGDALTPTEGMTAFDYLVGKSINNIIVSKKDFTLINDIEHARRDYTGTGPEQKKRNNRNNLTAAYVAPRTQTDKEIVKTIEDSLGLGPIGIKDNFFELGGDSLKAIIITNRINKKFSINLPVYTLFREPNLDSFIGKVQKILTEPHRNYLEIKTFEKKKYYPISPSQKRIFIFQYGNKNNTAYNISSVWNVDGHVDLETLNKNINAIIDRHEALRTGFITIENIPYQKCNKRIDFKVTYSDVSGNKKEQKDLLIESLIAKLNEPFDLMSPSLFRLGLIKTDIDKFILVFVVHHIIFDGISLEIFLGDLLKLYENKALESLKYQYKDFTNLQVRLKNTIEYKNQENYWIQKLKDNIPVLNLPTDFKRDQERNYSSEKIKFGFDDKLNNKLNERIISEGTTMFTYLVSIFSTFIHKITLQEDIIIGTPVTNRKHSEFDQVIGFFLNTVALRCMPKPKMSFKEFLNEVKDVTFEAFSNQDYYFDELVHKLNIKRESSRNPIFDVVLAYQKMRIVSDQEQHISDFKLTPYESKNSSTDFDLYLYVEDTEDKLYFILGYCTGLFKAETIHRFIEYYKEITEIVVNNPDILISDISLCHKLIEVKNESSNFDFEFND